MAKSATRRPSYPAVNRDTDINLTAEADTPETIMQLKYKKPKKRKPKVIEIHFCCPNCVHKIDVFVASDDVEVLCGCGFKMVRK